MSTPSDLRARVEYRFFWPHAQDDMNGARPRSQRPTLKEIAEWLEDLATAWVERRVVYEGPWERDPDFEADHIAALMWSNSDAPAEKADD